MLNNLLQVQLKLLQKQQFKKRRKQLVIWLVIKLKTKLQVLHRIVIQRLLPNRFQTVRYMSPKKKRANY